MPCTCCHLIGLCCRHFQRFNTNKDSIQTRPKLEVPFYYISSAALLLKGLGHLTVNKPVVKSWLFIFKPLDLRLYKNFHTICPTLFLRNFVADQMNCTCPKIICLLLRRHFVALTKEVKENLHTICLKRLLGNFVIIQVTLAARKLFTCVHGNVID